jgi:hypothetical protein
VPLLGGNPCRERVAGVPRARAPSLPRAPTRRRAGIKKGHLLEQALLHHLQAFDEIPVEYVIHPRVVVSRKTFEEMLGKAENPNPTSALRELMRTRDGD